MGVHGPIPQREESLVRGHRDVRAGDIPVTKGTARGGKPLNGKSTWHPLAKQWFNSLKKSGIADYYEQSDWATALIVAEELSNYLKTDPMRRNGQMLTTLLATMTSLGATEGERRRMRIELEPPKIQEVPASVTAISNYKKTLGVAE